MEAFGGVWAWMEALEAPQALEAPRRPLEAPGGFWRVARTPEGALEAPGGPWRPLEAPGGPAIPFLRFSVFLM